MKNKTLQEELIDLQKALRDLAYNFLKSIGIIWLVKKFSFLKLKDWAKERDKNK